MTRSIERTAIESGETFEKGIVQRLMQGCEEFLVEYGDIHCVAQGDQCGW
jgi:hypothetical protein